MGEAIGVVARACLPGTGQKRARRTPDEIGQDGDKDESVAYARERRGKEVKMRRWARGAVT